MERAKSSVEFHSRGERDRTGQQLEGELGYEAFNVLCGVFGKIRDTLGDLNGDVEVPEEREMVNI